MRDEEAEMFDIKKQLMWSKLKVGLVITLTLVIFFVTVFFAGAIEKLFSKKVELQAHIQDVKGLRKGAPVWISGIEVGSVKSMNLHPEHGTIVTLSIDRNALGFLRKDSEASILTMGLLGDKYIELSNGSPDAEPVKPGEVIRGRAQIDLKDVMETGAASIEKMAEIIGKLEGFADKVEKGEGTLARFLKDPAVYENLKETTKTLSLVLKDIKDGQGTLRMLLDDPSLYNRIFAATSSIEEFGKKLNEGQGTLKRLTEDPELYENLNKASKQLSLLLEKIDTGEGVAGELINDKELARDLKEVVGELKELTKDIREHPNKYFKFSIF